MVIILEVRMQTIQYLELPSSFEPNVPMSVQLKKERLKLFPIKKVVEPVTCKHPIIAEACKKLNITFDELALIKASRHTGCNLNLFAIVYYFRSRNICKLSYLQKYIFTQRDIYNYKRHIPQFIDKKKYIDLFNYLDEMK
jgi:hypothetical protein